MDLDKSHRECCHHCKVCNYKTNKLSNLIRHMRVHAASGSSISPATADAEKPHRGRCYPCNVCGVYHPGRGHGCCEASSRKPPSLPLLQLRDSDSYGAAHQGSYGRAALQMSPVRAKLCITDHIE
ncbi:uncharacterized protein LOC119168150 isoform X2 [Rhipicephalus microplus]|uniref:uncharacterized protein LOC119168150 isoform X2 n=1 Tax=Rhipicephalus microplus TaxID=6941 RepID=UPI003F6D03C8